jgi:hypothetical protein
MHPSPQHADVQGRLAKSSSQRITTALRGHDTSTATAESQNADALELAVELIELRYREYCARVELEILITEGGIGAGCL